MSIFVNLEPNNHKIVFWYLIRPLIPLPFCVNRQEQIRQSPKCDTLCYSRAQAALSHFCYCNNYSTGSVFNISAIIHHVLSLWTIIKSWWFAKIWLVVIFQIGNCFDKNEHDPKAIKHVKWPVLEIKFVKTILEFFKLKSLTSNDFNFWMKIAFFAAQAGYFVQMVG